MKYKLPDYREKEKLVGQTFSPLVKEYRLDEKLGTIVETGGYLDIHSEIQSYADCALNKILDRLLPEDVAKITAGNGVYVDYSQTCEDLEYLSQVAQVAEEYKEKLGLNPGLSIEDVFAEISKHSEKLKTRIETLENLKKVGATNETEIKKVGATNEKETK